MPAGTDLRASVYLGSKKKLSSPRFQNVVAGGNRDLTTLFAKGSPRSHVQGPGLFDYEDIGHWTLNLGRLLFHRTTTGEQHRGLRPDESGLAPWLPYFAPAALMQQRAVELHFEVESTNFPRSLDFCFPSVRFRF